MGAKETASLLMQKQGRQISMLLKRHTIDAEWVSMHYDELKEKYPDQYIAVLRRQVLDSDIDRENLLERLRSRFAEIDYITIDFISTKDLKLIL